MAVIAVLDAKQGACREGTSVLAEVWRHARVGVFRHAEDFVTPIGPASKVDVAGDGSDRSTLHEFCMPHRSSLERRCPCIMGREGLGCCRDTGGEGDVGLVPWVCSALNERET